MSIISKLLHDTIYAVAYRRSGDDSPFHIIKSSWRYWYADQILFKDKDKLWLFVEKMDRLWHKGIISVSLYDGHKFGLFSDILEEEFHLSYPMVFKKEDAYYMIPETADSNKVILYKSTDFPYKWHQHKTLLENCHCVDSNVFEFGGHWYLITCEMDAEMGAYTRLQLYNADDIENGLLEACEEYNASSTFHFDCRGGGQIFYANGNCLRPIQCGDAKTYGKSLRIDKIEIIKEYLYSECRKTYTIEDFKFNNTIHATGAHTYGNCGGIELIDVKIQELAHPIVHILKIFRKLLKKQY